MPWLNLQYITNLFGKINVYCYSEFSCNSGFYLHTCVYIVQCTYRTQHWMQVRWNNRCIVGGISADRCYIVEGDYSYVCRVSSGKLSVKINWKMFAKFLTQGVSGWYYYSLFMFKTFVVLYWPRFINKETYTHTHTHSQKTIHFGCFFTFRGEIGNENYDCL